MVPYDVAALVKNVRTGSKLHIEYSKWATSHLGRLITLFENEVIIADAKVVQTLRLANAHGYWVSQGDRVLDVKVGKAWDCNQFADIARHLVNVEVS